MRFQGKSPWGGSTSVETADDVWRYTPADHLSRIADALERIADALEASGTFSDEDPA